MSNPDQTATISEQSQKGSAIEAAARKKFGAFGWLVDVLSFVPFLGLKKLFAFDRAAAQMTDGQDVIGWWSDVCKLDLTVEGLENVPHQGPVLFFGNHPTGLGDGVATTEALKDRPNLRSMYIMNAQGFDSSPGVSDMTVSVRIKNGQRVGDKDELWNDMAAAVDDKRALFLFPSGHLAQPKKPWALNALYEKPWKPGVVTIPKRFPDLPVIPFRIEARNRRIYYWLNKLFPFMRDVLLFTEFHSKAGTKYKVTFMPPAKFDTPEAAMAHVLGNDENRLDLK